MKRDEVLVLVHGFRDLSPSWKGEHKDEEMLTSQKPGKGKEKQGRGTEGGKEEEGGGREREEKWREEMKREK